MITVEQILEQISGLNVESPAGPGSFTGLATLDAGDILQGMEETYSLQGMLSSGMFETISPNLIAGALQKTYSPMLSQSNKNLLGDLVRSTQGSEGAKAAGGFAGSGFYEDYVSQARDVYGQKAGAMLGDIQMKKQASLQGIQDIIQNWQDQAIQLAASDDT